MSRTQQSSWGSEIWLTPLPVISDTSATFLGLVIMETGSNWATVFANSAAQSRAASICSPQLSARVGHAIQQRA